MTRSRWWLPAALIAVVATACQDAPLDPTAELRPQFSEGEEHDRDDFHPPGAGAHGTHFRLGHINWRRISGREVEIEYVVGFRRSYYQQVYGMAINDGGTYNLRLGINMGDGTFVRPTNFRATFVDVANDWFEARAVYRHTFAGAAQTFIVTSIGCCRISPFGSPNGRFPWNHDNNADKNARFWAYVDLSGPGSAVTTLPAIVPCAPNALCEFPVVASVPGGTTIRYRMATPAEMGGSNLLQPAGAVIGTNTGLYSWNAVGQGSTPSDWYPVYSTQVVMETLSGARVVAASMVDFFIQITNPRNAPPAFTAPTPASGTVYTVTVGQSISLPISATDPDAGDRVTLATIGAPTGATLTTGAPGQTTSGTFSFTARSEHAGQSIVVSFSATDTRNLSGQPRSIVIRVPNTAPVVNAGADLVIECTGLGTTIRLNGSATDAEGNIARIEWLNGAAIIANSPVATVELPVGAYTLTLRATDSGGLVGNDGMNVTVQDRTAPSVSLAATPNTLWPPNHQYEAVTLTSTYSDGCAGLPSLLVWAEAWSNEPDDANGNGDGNTTGDVSAGGRVSSNAAPVVTFDPRTDTLQLRAERAGGGQGRTYTVKVYVKDPSGNVGSATTTVVVVHNQ